MDNPAVVIIVAVVGVVLGAAVGALFATGGNLTWLSTLRAVGRRARTDAEFAARIEALVKPPPPEPEKPVKPDPAPIRLLAILQRDGRLIDFLMEDLTGAPDAQVAAAVHQIHPKCQKALREHVTLEPVLPEKEGDEVQVPAGFDPSAIQLTGNVTGQPPFKGTLQHAGWHVAQIRLPKPVEGVDELVVQPAQVEMT
jgi:hypothetical protein